MRITIPVCLILAALAITFAPAAHAGGGANCDTHAKAKTAGAGTSGRAAKLAAKGWLGIETDKDQATGGYVVKTVAPSSPAAASGFRPGDVLVALNGVELKAENKDALKKVKSGLGVGSQVTYTVRRAGATQKLTTTLAPVPQDVLAKWVAEEEKQETVAVASKN